MRAQTQTMGQTPQVGVRVDAYQMDWLQRLVQWLKSFGQGSQAIEVVSPYGTWDAKREQYHHFKAESAVDLVAARNGISWASKVYSSSI